MAHRRARGAWRRGQHLDRVPAVEQAIAAFTPEETRTFATLFDRFVRAWPRD